MDIFILELVSNQLTVPVKIDGRQQQEETSISALLDQSHRTCARLQVQYLQEKKMRSWLACCFMVMFYLLATPVRIDGRQQHKETR